MFWVEPELHDPFWFWLCYRGPDGLKHMARLTLVDLVEAGTLEAAITAKAAWLADDARAAA